MQLLRKRRRLWILLGLVLFVLLVLPFLIPLGSTGANPVALAAQVAEGSAPSNADAQLLAALTAEGASYVDVNGVSAFIVQRGAADAPPVLFVHGFGGSTFSWRLTLDDVAGAGFRAIALDLPPFGFSERSADFDYSREALAEFIAGLMDALNVERAILVGHSMGGGVIAHFAIKYPERVEQLVFVAGAVEAGGSGVGRLLGFPPLARWVQIGARTFITPERLSEILLSAYYNPGFIDDTVLTGYQLPLRTEGWDTGLVAFIRDSGGGVSADQLATISANTLLLWGEQDTWVPLARGQSLAEMLPNAVIQTYPRVGHLPMEEVADAFNLDLITFLLTGTLPSETEFLG
jgi:pimeloyl-ACP methyl ester carboxylesterase